MEVTVQFGGVGACGVRFETTEVLDRSIEDDVCVYEGDGGR
jgi:hypothetical protein